MELRYYFKHSLKKKNNQRTSACYVYVHNSAGLKQLHSVSVECLCSIAHSADSKLLIVSWCFLLMFIQLYSVESNLAVIADNKITLIL